MKPKKKECPTCNGKGWIYGYLGIRPRSIPLGQCIDCDGTGKVGDPLFRLAGFVRYAIGVDKKNDREIADGIRGWIKGKRPLEKFPIPENNKNDVESNCITCGYNLAIKEWSERLGL